MAANINKNGIIRCSPIEGFDKASIMKNDVVVGENLVANSHQGWSSTAYNIIQGTMAKPWEVGKTYTVTIKGTIDTGDFGIWCDTGYACLILGIPYRGNGLYSGTGTVTDSADVNRFSIWHTPNVEGKLATVEWIKIEEGSKATPWCPAPADGLGETPSAYTNPIQANDFYEI